MPEAVPNQQYISFLLMNYNKIKKKRILSASRIPKFKKIMAATAAGAVLLVIIGYVSQCTSQKETATAYAPAYEIYPEKEIVPQRRIPDPKPLLPKVAIIIDDVGYDCLMGEAFLNLDTNITLSVFPHSPCRHQISRKAEIAGVEIMLHLPMEPVEYPAVNPGTGALLTDMTPEELIRQLEQNLDSVPLIKGVNNHMGSRMTAMSAGMYQILSAVKKRNLFFIDSLTTEDSICHSCARLLQIPFAQRDVFIDHVQTPVFIRQQLLLLIRTAENYGEAIGIGHPHTVTYDMLVEMLPEIKKKVRLVPASEVVHTGG